MASAFVFDADPRRPWLAARSRRSLLAAGFAARDIHPEIPDDNTHISPCLLLRAGQAFADPHTFAVPPEGRPLLAIGLPPDTHRDASWHNFHALHGGDYPPEAPLPAPLCEWHFSMANARARLLGQPLPTPPRRVHWSPLDLTDCRDSLCVWQIVTSLQHGGAERIALELAKTLPNHDITSRLVVLGKPHRRTLDAPPGTLDLSHIPRHHRASLLAQLAVRHGADVLHVHLTDAGETAELAASGIPVIATVHNSRPGWPRGWDALPPDAVKLLLACSVAVETEIRQMLPHVPVRTVWNGINPSDFPETPRPDTGSTFTLACIANPRPQKQLQKLPAILSATRVALSACGVPAPDVRLILAAEASPTLPDALSCRREFEAEAARLGVTGQIHWTDGAMPIAEVLASAHALVSCSAYEGLSLAHLEALACGRPVIACDTGGTRELAHNNPAVTLLPPDASAEAFAHSISEALLHPPASARPLIYRDFHIQRMASRVARLTRQTARHSSANGTTLWFLANNLSTGGAQSSLRRLLMSLHTQGHRIRVALLQEYPDSPTTGRTALLDAGIPVFVPPPAGVITPEQAVELILDEMAADPPAAMTFWNAISSHKLLFADALPFTRIYDISPGEMFFSSLDRCLENPLPGLPCRSAADYGRLLSGVVVKYAAEAPRASQLSCPVHIIPNGVPFDTTTSPHPVMSSGVPLVFSTAARISPQKHLEDLIHAFRIALPSLPPSILRIAGGTEHGADTYADDLRLLAEGLPIQWSGEIQDLSSFHRETDIFTMVSDPAGCPNASLEALAAGLPVIATDVGGASEQVIDRITGLLVPPRDPAALARAMIELAHNPILRGSLGLAGHRHICERFHMQAMTDAYRQLLLPSA